MPYLSNSHSENTNMAKANFPPFHPLSSAQPSSMSREDFDGAFAAESDSVERKSGTGQNPIARAITAFSNTEGGVLLVGVNDQGQLLGRPLTEGVEAAIHTAALTIHDPGRYWIKEVDLDGTPVV